MKCPRCGASNKPDAVACFRCGAPLPAQDATAGQRQAEPAPAADSGRTARSLWYPPKAKQPPVSGSRAFPETAETPFISLDSAADSRKPADAGKLSSFRDGEQVTIVVPPEPEPPVDPAALRRRKLRIRRTVSVLLVLLLLAGVGYGGTRLVRSITSAYRGWQQRRYEASLPPEPLVERVLVDGAQWHKITFYGEDGERVLIENTQESKAIRDGIAEFFLSDDYFVSLNSDSDESVITVTLAATLFSATGSETALTVPSYTIDIPDSPLKLILPEEQEYTTNENRISIKLKVTPGSRVLIGENNVSDLVDAEGYLTTTAPVEPIGENIIEITVETDGHRRTIYDLKVNRPELAVDFKLGDEYTPPAKTKDSTITFKGVTEPGAVITTEAKVSEGSLDVDSATGAFDFTVKFTHYGENLIDFTVRTADGRTSQITYRIERLADITSYSKAAQVIDYPYLSASAPAMIGRIFQCQGVVVKKMDDETSDYFLYNIGTEAAPQYIVLEDFLTTPLEVGKEYILFADVNGVYDEYPLLSARFSKLQ